MASIYNAPFSLYKNILHFVDDWVREPLFGRVPNPPTTPSVGPNNMSSGYSICTLPDGATLAYEVLGSFHLGRAMPIVLICGMSAMRTDYEKLSQTLMKTRPVLIYDLRGMGDSTLSTAADEDITIELYARDLVSLLVHLKWKEVSICGYSMGGVIAQQLLLLPHHSINPRPLPFRVTHLFLISTRSVVQKVGLAGITGPSSNTKRTPAERKEIARRVLTALFDPTWLEVNGERFDYLFSKAIAGLAKKPSEIIAKQGIALQNFNFEGLLDRLPQDLQIMVIHGQLDQIVPFYCGEDILKRIPSARLVEEGEKPGQVPSLQFGHNWCEYFNTQIWHDVIDKFIGDLEICL